MGFLAAATKRRSILYGSGRARRPGGHGEDWALMTGTIEILDYQPGWTATFDLLRTAIAGQLGDLAVGIEHVGSTAVPGLPAKPIIDLDVVIASRDDLPEAVHRLAGLGYVHEGDLGIAGREAFATPAGVPAHHLYVCVAGGGPLAEHLTFRDALRASPRLVAEYAALKRSLAAASGGDRDRYSAGKTDFVRRILATAAPMDATDAGGGTVALADATDAGSGTPAPPAATVTGGGTTP